MAECSYPTLIPYLTVRHARESITFYEKAFGFIYKNPDESQDDEDMQHVEMTFGNAIIMFAPENAVGCEGMVETKAPKTLGVIPSMTLYVYCSNVDELYERAVQAGAVSLMPPQDSFWGDRFCKLGDPDGFEWMFAHRLKQDA